MNSNNNRSGNEGYSPHPVVSMKNDEMKTCLQEMHEIPKSAPLQNVSASSIDAFDIPQDNENKFVSGGSQNIDDQTNTHHQHKMREYFLPQFKNLRSLDEYLTQMDDRLNGADRHLLETNQNFDDLIPQNSRVSSRGKYDRKNSCFLKFLLPYKFEAGECAETIQALPLHDKNKMIDTRNVRKRLLYELYTKKCSKTDFCKRVFGKKNLFRYFFTDKEPKPFNEMRTGKLIYEKTFEWLMLCDEDKKAVLDGKETKCCSFEIMKWMNSTTSPGLHFDPQCSKNKAGNFSLSWPGSPSQLPINEQSNSKVHGHNLKQSNIKQQDYHQLIKCEQQNKATKQKFARFNAPFNFETGESMESILALPLYNHAGTINFRNIIRRLLYELHLNGCTKFQFWQRVLGKAVKPNVFYALTKQPTLGSRRSTKELVVSKVFEWIMMCPEDRKAVLNGKETTCCCFEPMKST